MDKIQATLKWWLRRALDISFDALHGVDTTAVIPPAAQHAASPHRNADPPYAYDPSPWRIVSRCKNLAGISRLRDFSFVDIGCGKGKVLLSAMALPFAKIIGVEFSPYLCEIAQQNVRSARLLRRRCPNVEIVCCDAGYWSPPSETSLIFFFYNPFDFNVMQKLLFNIVSSQKNEGGANYLIFYRMSSSLANIDKVLFKVSNGSAVKIASTQTLRGSVNIYHLPGR